MFWQTGGYNYRAALRAVTEYSCYSSEHRGQMRRIGLVFNFSTTNRWHVKYINIFGRVTG